MGGGGRGWEGVGGDGRGWEGMGGGGRGWEGVGGDGRKVYRLDQTLPITIHHQSIHACYLHLQRLSITQYPSLYWRRTCSVPPLSYSLAEHGLYLEEVQ